MVKPLCIILMGVVALVSTNTLPISPDVSLKHRNRRFEFREPNQVPRNTERNKDFIRHGILGAFITAGGAYITNRNRSTICCLSAFAGLAVGWLSYVDQQSLTNTHNTESPKTENPSVKCLQALQFNDEEARFKLKKPAPMKNPSKEKPYSTLIGGSLGVLAGLTLQEDNQSTMTTILKSFFLGAVGTGLGYISQTFQRYNLEDAHAAYKATTAITDGLNLYGCAATDNVQGVQHYLEKDSFAWFTKDKYCFNPLMYAAANKAHNVVKAIVKLVNSYTRPSLNNKDDQGRTALHIALYNKDTESAALLLDAGTDTEIEDNNGKTARQLLVPLYDNERLKTAANKRNIYI